MNSFSDEFTFDDNSTLSSFTGLREHCKGSDAEYSAGNNDTELRFNEGTAVESIDRRSDDDIYEDKENSKRDGILSNLRASFSWSGSSSRRSSISKSDGSSQSSAKFWANLSAYVASVAITSSVECNLPNSMAEAAADAAAKSLLEDCQAMEAINAQYLGQKQQQSKIATKPPMEITKQTVRNAATKASIAVLKSGVDQEVAAAVASAILREGSIMISKSQVRGQINSKETHSTSSSSSTVFTSPSKAYRKKSYSMKKKKTKNYTQNLELSSSSALYESQNIHSLVKSQHGVSNSPTTFCLGNIGNAESIAFLNTLPEGSIILKSQDSFAIMNTPHANPLTELPREHSPWAQQHDEASTIKSISSIFGDDKYDVSDTHSLMSGSISITKYNDKYTISHMDSLVSDSTLKGAQGAKHSPLANVELNDDANFPMTEEVLNAVRAAVQIVKMEDQNNVQTTESKSTSSRTSVSSNDAHMNEEVMKAVREAMAMEETKDLTLDNSLSTNLAKRSQSKEDHVPASSLPKQQSSSTFPTRQKAVSDNNTSSASPLPSCRRQENMSGRRELCEQVISASLESETSDDSTIETENYHGLQQLSPSVSGQSTHADNESYAMESSVDVQSISGSVYYSFDNENQQTIGQQNSHQLEEERELELKQATYLAAVDLLQNKLSELESADGSEPATKEQHHPPQQDQQLHQLSMLGNPAMSEIGKTSSSTWTPMIANTTKVHPSIHQVASSSSSHYPPLPPLGSGTSAGITHHGYNHIADASLTSLSVGSDSDSHKTTGSAGQKSAPSVISSVRSLLDTGSKCFPIVEMSDETDTNLDHMNESGSHSQELMVEKMKDEGETKELKETDVDTVDVLPVPEQNPNSLKRPNQNSLIESNHKSLATKFKCRFRVFFRRKHKKVTLAKNVAINGNEPSPPQAQLFSPKKRVSFFSEVGRRGSAASTSPTVCPVASNSKRDASYKSRRLGKLRTSFIRLFKPSSSNAEDSNSGGVDGVATTACPSVDGCSSSLVAASNKPKTESILRNSSAQCTINVISKVEADQDQSSQASEADHDADNLHNESYLCSVTRSNGEMKSSTLCISASEEIVETVLSNLVGAEMENEVTGIVEGKMEGEEGTEEGNEAEGGEMEGDDHPHAATFGRTYSM